MGGAAFERVERAVLEKRSPLVLGLDPRPDRMPPGYPADLDGILRYHGRLIDLVEPRIVAVKPQIAFFEGLGTGGLEVYAATCARARDRGLVVIGDVKRGDIGSTATAYARAHFGWADILTVQPYLGDDSVEPFLACCRDHGKAIFVVCATSNPGWARFQAVEDRDGCPLYLHVARAVAAWNASCGEPGRGPVGAVVGATRPDVLGRVRRILPEAWLLLPGIGAQGGRVADVAAAFAADGTGALLPVSRGLAGCFEPGDPDWEARVVAAAADLVTAARAVIPALGPD